MPGTTPQNDPSLSRKILAGVGFAATLNIGIIVLNM